MCEEDERKGLEKEYEGRVEKLIMKDGGTDVQWGIEIAGVGEESLEVKIKFVEDEDNSLEVISQNVSGSLQSYYNLRKRNI